MMSAYVFLIELSCALLFVRALMSSGIARPHCFTSSPVEFPVGSTAGTFYLMVFYGVERVEEDELTV